MADNLPSPDRVGKSLAVVIVTYNRCKDLETTLAALQAMQSDFDYLIVVDNASTDDTPAVLQDAGKNFEQKLKVIRSPENLGGAGGFHQGVKAAAQLPVDWIWMSDDDALPQPGCLSQLLRRAESEENVYGGVAVVRGSDCEELCWPAPVIKKPSQEGSSRFVSTRHELNPTQQVLMLPFLGLMVSRKKVLQAGLPNKSYFISGDDAEYCIRMRQSGSSIIQVRDSVLVHPRIPRYHVRLPGKDFHCLALAPWRRYYEVRNRIWNARQKSPVTGALASTATHLLRLAFTMLYEKERYGQTSAYFRGIKDGILASPGR